MKDEWRGTLMGIATFAWLFAASPGDAQVIAKDQMLTTITPCRLVDTRNILRFGANTTRQFNIFGNLSSQGGNPSGCGIPGFSNGVAQVQALELNYVAVDPATGGVAGFLVAWPTDKPKPATSVINYQTLNPNLNVANGTVTAVRQDSPGGDITVNASRPVDVVIDVVGYFTKSERHTNLHPTSPNLIAGVSSNSVGPTVFGATISGGGSSGAPNVVSSDYST